MWIQSLNITNVRSFPSAALNLSRHINVIVGRNNAGKSSLLLPLFHLQNGLPQLQARDLRFGATTSQCIIQLEDLPDASKHRNASVKIELHGNQFVTTANRDGHDTQFPKFQNREDSNLIYPFISKRKVVELNEQITAEHVTAIAPNFVNLNNKIDRLVNADFFPAHNFYMRACQEVLGFTVSTGGTTRGKQAVYTVKNALSVPIQSMGEGVMNAIGLIADLAVAEQKVFIVEEPENDLHPQALKALIDLILEKSAENQFIVTTHSSIALKRLASRGTCNIFHVECGFPDRVPTATVQEVDSAADARRKILEDLGYEYADDDHWEGWLILEESSAEKIIRQYLIPWFYPELVGRLRTYSARTLSEVGPKFRYFADLFVFLNLEPVYKNRAWAVVDAGKEEGEIISQMKDQYVKAGWKEEHFLQFSQHDFEQYYPARFSERVSTVLQLPEKGQRRAMKRELLSEVEAWITSDPQAARTAFESSAREVLGILEMIRIAMPNGEQRL